MLEWASVMNLVMLVPRDDAGKERQDHWMPGHDKARDLTANQRKHDMTFWEVSSM